MTGEDSRIIGKITAHGSLSGELSGAPALSGEITPRGSISGSLTAHGSIVGEMSPRATIVGSLAMKGLQGDVYEGQTYVVPRAYDNVVLETQYKLMNDNVTVSAVPFFETSNLSGGFTVYIARE